MANSFRLMVVMGALVTGIAVPAVPAAAAEPGAIAGIAYDDANRNGIRDIGETPRAGDALYLYDGTGTAIATTTTAADGSYRFGGLLRDAYRVTYTLPAWRAIRTGFVPTTTSSVERPSRNAVAGDDVDFGWRRILRSTTAGAPISAYVGVEGLSVESYNDVVEARQLYDLLAQSRLRAEAAHVTVQLDLSGTTATSAAIHATAGVYDGYSAVSHIAWGAWLDRGAMVLSHEYGHAWSLYYAHLAQQDPDLTGYLRARGLEGDLRIGTSSDWYPGEMIAEDYRQLLGPAAGQPTQQANRDIPPAAEVPGLYDYLTTTFEASTAVPTAAPSPTASPSPTATATAAPSPSPTATATPEASPSPTTTATASATAEPSPSPTATATVTATSSPSPTTSSTTSPAPSGRTKGGGSTCRKCA